MRGRAWREIPDPLAGVESLGEGRAHVDGRRDLFAEYLVAEQLARDRGSPVDSVGDDDATRLVAAAQLPRLVMSSMKQEVEWKSTPLGLTGTRSKSETVVTAARVANALPWFG